MNNFNLDQMNRNELLQLQEEVKSQLKRFRPYRIKERFTTCSNERCWCKDGYDLHGPYLYATYREAGVTRSKSLGPKLDEWEIREAIPPYPVIDDYLSVPNHKYENMPVSEVRGWVYMVLSDRDFELRYGVSKSEDKFNRADKFWGSAADYEQYKIDVALYEDYQELPYNPWVGWGVGNMKAVATLIKLEERGYYQK